MKRNFFALVLSLMCFGYAQAQTGYCSKAQNADGTTTFEWSKAKNFCPILVSQDVYQTMEASGIKADFQVDDTNSHLYIWDGTYTSLDASGQNSFGGDGGYLDMKVGTAGWSGLGFINDKGIDLSFLSDDYYLHFGTRGTTDTHEIQFGGSAFSIGNGVMDSKENLGNWKNDGNWYYFDIPVSKLKELGMSLSASYKDNYLVALSGGTAGVELTLENVFLYQRTEGTIEPKPEADVPEPPYSTKANNADGTTTFDWSDAQNFCPILVSDDVYQIMEAAGIKRDMQVNDETSHLYIWEGTYTAKDATGQNSFGGNGGYIDMTVNSVGWSGLGFINDGGLNLEFLDDSYYLHFGTRGKPSTQTISLGGVSFCIGEGTADNNPNFGTWTNDGSWYYFDVPLAKLRKIGNLFPGAANYKENYLTALSGGTAGTELILENIFIYQKKSLASEEDPDNPDNPDEPEEEDIPAGPYYASATAAPFNWDNATDFCPIIVSEDVYNHMDAAGIKLDMQINDETSHLWIWNGYDAKEATGTNSFGGEGGFVDFVTNGNGGWSGLGLINDAGLDMSFLADKGYYFHFGTKGTPNTHTITLGGVSFCIGEGTMDGNKNLGCWTNDGDWWYYDIPCALLKSMGNFFNDCSKAYKDNYLTALSGGNAGVDLILENVFLYRKKDMGDNGGNEESDVKYLVDYTPAKTENVRSFKRGVGENAFSAKGEMTALEPGVSWYYNWGGSPTTALNGTDVEFVPMAWNASGITAAVNCVKNNGAKYILGFNEPNFKDQANMTPTQAAIAWKQLEDAVKGLDVELVAPALNYTSGPINDGNTYQPETWMDGFINAYKGMNSGKEPRIDYLALHCYMNDHGAMKDFVENFAKKYGKKVWLTEFCAWEGTVSEATQKTQMLNKLKDLEESEYVYRYAWFKAKGSNVEPYYRLLNGTKLTDIGASYVYSTIYYDSRYFTAGEQIPAKDYMTCNTISLEAGNDADAAAQGLQIGSFDMGASATYQIDVPATQVYTLAIRMSDRAYLSPLKVGVYLDGSTTATVSQELSPSGKTATKDAWVTEGFNLTLPEGKHTMQIKSLQSTDCKLQWLSFFHNEFTEDIKDLTPALSQGEGVYNTQGQRVNADYKGIIIKNGKKYVNK